MHHRKVARQSRAATTGPGVKACGEAASTPRDHSTQAPAQRHAAPSESSPTRRHREPIATEAEILLGAAMWLCRVRAWMTEQLDLAETAEGTPSETVTLRRADLAAFHNGIGQAVSLLDSLTVDPAQLPQPAEPSAAPATIERTVH